MGGQRAVPGYSLLELLVTLSLLGGIALLAGPAYERFLAQYRLRSQAHALAGTLNLARSEAVKRGLRVNVCPSTDGTTCDDVGFEAGWLLHVDADNQGQPDPGERPLRSEPQAPPGITIRGNRPVADFVSYTAYGHARRPNGALQMGTFTVCSPGLPAVHVILAHSGRVRIVETATRCS
jgi:type IV fimbrial biogenesis protein FimT